MRSLLLSSSFLSFVLLALADPLLSPLVRHEERRHIPAGWSHTGKHSSSSILPLRFALSQSNLDKVEQYLNDVSHPDSPNYGAHWSPAQVAKTFAPSDETIDAVREWLSSSGIDRARIRLTPAKSWIEVNATVEEAERLLNTEYHVYEHDTGKKHIACDSYHLPAHVAPHIELVTPTVHWNAILDKRAGAAGPEIKIGAPGVGAVSPKTTGNIKTLLNELEDCDQQITPICLRALYGLIYEPLATSENSYGIVEYTPQAYIESDIQMFAANFSTDLIGKSPVLSSIDGGVVQSEETGFGVNGESNLDFQYGMTLVTGRQPVTLYQVGDLVEGASFNNLLDALDGSYCTFEGGDDPTQDGIYPDPFGDGGYEGPEQCGTVKPANVISTSYAYDEADLTPAYTARQCAEYAKLGMMGVTVLYSSGDYGVAGNGGNCLNPDGSQTPDGAIFNPSFPGTCPYITSVGATQVNPGAKVTDPESACEQVIYSGGGFSNYFAMPDYQKSAVESYLAKYKPSYPASIWNSTGLSRGFPDISANGANYVVAVDGEFALVFGTSCASPVVGAILTMVNDARIIIGKKPIGFINPTIYSSSFEGAFNDITSGGNQGCGTAGYTAVPGWDPVTGLGTPNFPKLVARWLLMP